MQCQKHKQAKCYNKSAKDLPSLKTGDAVYVQLGPKIRKWIPGIAIERIRARSYKVKTIKGGIYIRNRKFIRIKHTDLKQSLQTTKENRVPSYNDTHTGRPERITRRPQRLVESMNLSEHGAHKEELHKDSTHSLRCNLNGLCTYIY